MLVLDHIGYAIANIQQYLETFFVPLFQPCAVSDIVPDPVQRVRIAFVTLSGGARIELIEPLDENSPVSKLLEAKRGGLYHVCFKVENLNQEIARFRKKGCILISEPSQAIALGGRLIAFLATPTFDLIEFVEQDYRAGAVE